MLDRKRTAHDLEGALGYSFRNVLLVKEALTHASTRSGQRGVDSERLEFLGDRVLGLCIASALYERFPDAAETDFALCYNQLVSEGQCAEIAERLDLGRYIVMAPSEARSGGRRKPVILADACEAVLGAIFIDGGFEAANTAVRSLWADRIANVEPKRDAKTALQEFAQSQKRGLPRYIEVEKLGTEHAPTFTVDVTVDGFDAARGFGPSKPKAQQAAAEAFLVREAIWPVSERNA